MNTGRDNQLNSNLPQGEEHTISIEKANIVALILIIPITILYALPYYFIWKENIFGSLKLINLGIFLLSLPVGIGLHELLHGATWALFIRGGFKSIRFGIKWEYLTPYCHSNVPMKVWQYVIGGLMPLIFMGIVPAVISLFIGNKLLMFFAMFFTWTAGGDIQVTCMLRKFGRNQMVLDHPHDPGFIVIRDLE
jgi:hypothetical protein